MIIKGDKEVEQAPVVVNRAVDTESTPSNPPPYSAQNDASGSTDIPNPVPSGSALPPPAGTRCNFLTIRRDNSAIKGAFIVDPNLVVPDRLLAPLQDDESEAERPNLKLRSMNASINVDVYVDSHGDRDSEGDASASKRDANRDTKKVIIDAYTRNGSVTVKLTADLLIQPVKISVRSDNGAVSLILPSTFNGPLTIGSKNGAVVISKLIQDRSTTFSDVKGLRSCFVGDFGQAAGLGTDEWPGSSVHVETHNGRAKIAFTEEEVENEWNRGLPGFFSRWFGGV